MYDLIRRKLEERPAEVAVAVVGCGWFGAGVVREIFRISGLRVCAIIDRIPERAVATYGECGVPESDIAFVGDGLELFAAEGSGKHIVASDIRLIRDMRAVDVVFEATGSILAGAETAIASIESGIHFVTVNSEMDATIGLELAGLAEKSGVVYSNSDGDQPGCLSRLIGQVYMMGFRPRVVGNSKGFLDVHQTPKGVLPFVPKGQDPTKSCSFADGSKQALELCVVANAFGFPPRKRGMFGPTTTKQEIVRSFAGVADLQAESPAFVDYVMGMDGVDQGGGIFVIASREGRHIGPDLDYMKKGRGPNYLFFRDHHLCYLEAASTIAEAALFSVPTLVAKGRYADVVAVAKRGLPAGQKLDGIGGFDCYGLIDSADAAAEGALLPLGIAEFATLRVDVARDTPITYTMVDLDDTLVVRLRRDQGGDRFRGQRS